MKLICKPNMKAMKVDSPFTGHKVHQQTDMHGDHHAPATKQTLIVRRG